MNDENPRVYFYIAAGALALAATAFGLAFSPLGVYALIASIILDIAGLSFLTTQRKKNNFRGVLYLTIVAYALLAVTVTIFIIGMIYNATLV